jgi:hypothetical protein
VTNYTKGWQSADREPEAACDKKPILAAAITNIIDKPAVSLNQGEDRRRHSFRNVANFTEIQTMDEVQKTTFTN